MLVDNKRFEENFLNKLDFLDCICFVEMFVWLDKLGGNV